MNFNNIMKFTDIKITYPQLLKNLEITESMYDVHFTLWHKKVFPKVVLIQLQILTVVSPTFPYSFQIQNLLVQRNILNQDIYSALQAGVYNYFFCQ